MGSSGAMQGSCGQWLINGPELEVFWGIEAGLGAGEVLRLRRLRG